MSQRFQVLTSNEIREVHGGQRPADFHIKPKAPYGSPSPLHGALAFASMAFDDPKYRPPSVPRGGYQTLMGDVHDRDGRKIWRQPNR